MSGVPHEPLTEGHVSTGQLPEDELVRGLLVAAYERYRPVDEGRVADYIPALAACHRISSAPASSMPDGRTVRAR